MHASKCEIVITTVYTAYVWVGHTDCQDGGSGTHMAVAGGRTRSRALSFCMT